MSDRFLRSSTGSSSSSSPIPHFWIPCHVCTSIYSSQSWGCGECQVENPLMTMNGEAHPCADWTDLGPPSPTSTTTASSSASSATKGEPSIKPPPYWPGVRDNLEEHLISDLANIVYQMILPKSRLPKAIVHLKNILQYLPDRVLLAIGAIGSQFKSSTFQELIRGVGGGHTLGLDHIIGLGFVRVLADGMKGKSHNVNLTISSGVGKEKVSITVILNLFSKFRDSSTASNTTNTKPHQRFHAKSRKDYIIITDVNNRIAIVFCAVNALSPTKQVTSNHLPELQPVTSAGKNIIQLCYGYPEMRTTFVGVYLKDPSLNVNVTMRGVCSHHRGAGECRHGCKLDVESYLGAEARVHDHQARRMGEVQTFLNQPQPALFIKCGKCGGIYPDQSVCSKCYPKEAALDAEEDENEADTSIGSLTPPHSAKSSSSQATTPSFESLTPSCDSPYSMYTQTTELSDGTSFSEVSEANSHFCHSDQINGQPNEYTMDEEEEKNLVQQDHEEPQQGQAHQLPPAHMDEEDEGELVALPELYILPQAPPMDEDGPQPMDWYLFDDQPGPIPQPNGVGKIEFEEKMD